jgi:anthranilate synthase/aminodeoxychorismate synthase-like glutamine amidotransferase
MLLDNYDSFTYNLKDYLEQLGAQVMVVRNDEKTMEELHNLRMKGIVISPGPGKPHHCGILMELIAYYHQQIPILGICLGHQAIGEYFGAKLGKANEPVHGKKSEVIVSGHPMFYNIPTTFNVCRYHSMILEEPITEPLEVTAKTADGTIMAIAHRTLPVWGVQYHPEAILTENGHQLLLNWYCLTGLL